MHGLTSANDGSNQESSFPYGELWLYVYHDESRQEVDLGEAQTNHRIEQNSIHDRVSFNAQLNLVKGDARRVLRVTLRVGRRETEALVTRPRRCTCFWPTTFSLDSLSLSYKASYVRGHSNSSGMPKSSCQR